jgi:beta-1,4-N-acetylglucosaminyltransferase
MASSVARQGQKRSRVLLVASSGGHLLELLQVSGTFPRAERLWVTFDKADARDLLEGEEVIYAHHPTNRNLPNLLRNARLAARVMVRVRPRAVVTTGAGVAVPFCYTGRVSGARVIYIESLARVSTLSLSGRLVYPVVHRFFVQWPDLAAARKRAEYRGAIFDPA